MPNSEMSEGSSQTIRTKRTVDNLWDIELREVDSQIRIFGNFEIFVHPRQAADDPIAGLSIHATPVSSLAVLNRSRDVDEEEVAARTRFVRDCLADCLSACFVRGRGCRDNCCASPRELGRNKRYLLQVIESLFPRKGMICEMSISRQTTQNDLIHLVRAHDESNLLVTETRSVHLVR